jgi:methionyl-tRNA formyltransferase
MKTKIIILTSTRYGMASRVLPVLCNNKGLDVIKVILAHGVSPNRKRNFKRKILKINRIGILGALNGIRMRKWFQDKETEDIFSLCDSLNVPLTEVPFINCETTKTLFKNANADLGLSLGNGYISESIFSIPKYGMINIHTELLPKFQGAESIIWPIYEKSGETGFTIHQIDKKIDTGDILYQKIYPIQFHSTLRKTVEKNLQDVRNEIPDAFSYVCENYLTLLDNAKPQSQGKSYTTPSYWQFLHMIKNHRAMYQKT